MFRGGRLGGCMHTYDNIISTENLLLAWKEFRRGKKRKKDVQVFEYQLIENVQDLQRELQECEYVHGTYEHFKISDPKPRDIHKATVRDRLLHHALYRQLYPFFDRTFISESYSCRKKKGTHRAMNQFRKFAGQVSKNHTRTCWVLKCDIRRFFASVDHAVLKSILQDYIEDKDILWLLGQVIDSFQTQDSTIYGTVRGLPLGNLTSQLLVNIYMNEFDQYMKHTFKVKYYIRYADDFVILAHNKRELDEIYRCIGIFLYEQLKLELHPNKCSIRTFASGVDFLGWVHFPTHRVLRTATKRRMMRRFAEVPPDEASCASYLGMLSHGDTHKIQNRIN